MTPPSKGKTTVQISGRLPSGVPFTAGVVALAGHVLEVAPILRRHVPLGMTGRDLADLCRRRGWQSVVADFAQNTA
jgi:hypothetical protein